LNKKAEFMWKIAVTILALGWISIYLSSYGVLMGSQLIPSESGGQDTLKCSYFVGVSILDIEFWHSSNNIMGKAICPRLYDFAGD